MRRIIFESSVSIDGFVEGPGGDLGWIKDLTSASNGAGRSFLSAFDTIFYGRKTYERLGLFRVPPDQLTCREKEMFCLMFGMRKYVFSRTVKHLPGNAMVIAENVEEEVLRIRGEYGKDIWLCGGPDLLRTFTRHDLVDEYVLTVQPVLLRSGRPLFEENRWPSDLRLVARSESSSGIITLNYKPENRLTYGSRSVQDQCP